MTEPFTNAYNRAPPSVVSGQGVRLAHLTAEEIAEAAARPMAR